MGRAISKAEKEITLRMSLQSGLNDTQIAEYTGIRPRTMRGLRKRFRETGEIVKKPVVSGRPRLLNSLDAMVGALNTCLCMSYTFIQFIEDLVVRQPDIMLREIAEYLRQICHINASLATITRTLRNRGYSRKKVVPLLINRRDL